MIRGQTFEITSDFTVSHVEFVSGSIRSALVMIANAIIKKIMEMVPPTPTYNGMVDHENCQETLEYEGV
jgi:hypothetical protein